VGASQRMEASPGQLEMCSVLVLLVDLLFPGTQLPLEMLLQLKLIDQRRRTNVAKEVPEHSNFTLIYYLAVLLAVFWQRGPAPGSCPTSSRIGN
jgi:hypothetical protein